MLYRRIIFGVKTPFNFYYCIFEWSMTLQAIFYLSFQSQSFITLVFCFSSTDESSFNNFSFDK